MACCWTAFADWAVDDLEVGFAETIPADGPVGAFTLELRAGAVGVLDEGVDEKRSVMHSWICASRRLSPGGSSFPHTGHSSSSLISLLCRGCGGAEGDGTIGGRVLGNIGGSRDPGSG